MLLHLKYTYDMKRSLLSYLALLLFLCSTVNAQNNAITFDGFDDYVDMGTSSLLNANTIRTMECWVKFNSLATDQEILSKSAASQGIELLVFGGNLAFYAMYNGPNGSWVSYPVAGNLVTNRWYHIAVTWNGTKESMQLLVNGVPVGTRSDAGNINPTGITNPAGSFKVGQWSDASSRPLNGTVDEVRIWNVNRTATQIKQNMVGALTNTTGLVAYYQMNETSGLTTANNTANPGLTGTLTNGAGRTASPIQYSADALQIDGINDYVTIPGSSLYNISTGTVEFMVNPTALNPAVNACILGVRGTGGTRFSFHITPTTIGFFNNIYYVLNYTFNTGTWYHLAFVCNGAITNCYVNGVLIGAFLAAFGSGVNQPLIIGRVIEATQFEPFNGSVDEVRIWSTQRTQPQISGNMGVSLVGNETGLLGLYTFNQGTPGGDNTGLTTALDRTANNNNGTLVNFALTGTTSNYVSNPMGTLPVTYSAFTATKQSGQSVLQWQTEEELNSAEYVIERSADGSKYEPIGTVAAAGNSALSNRYFFTDRYPLTGKNYYRLKQVDIDGRFTYSVILSIDYASLHRLLWYNAGSHAVEVRLQGGGAERYSLLDLKGSILQKGYLRNGRAHFSNLQAGSYIIQVQANEIMTMKLLVQ